jgi:photosystem II stability/assembly factor-like uncharacterized protein
MSILVPAVFVITLTLVTLGRALLLAAEGETKKVGGGSDYIHALAMDAEARAMFLGTHFGLFRSLDGGRSWKRMLLPTKRPHLDVVAIAPDVKYPLTLYIATHEAGILKSTDGGTTWRESNTGLAGLDVHGLAVHPTNPSRVYAAVRGKDRGIYLSTDGGGKWVCMDDGPSGEFNMLALAKIPKEKTGIYLYMGTDKGLYRSEESLGVWKLVSSLVVNQAVKGFAVDPLDPKVMYVVMRDGLFYSTDAGVTWKSVGQGVTNLTAVVVNPNRPAEVYALSGDGFIFKSSDRAMTWELLGSKREQSL